MSTNTTLDYKHRQDIQIKNHYAIKKSLIVIIFFLFVWDYVPLFCDMQMNSVNWIVDATTAYEHVVLKDVCSILGKSKHSED